MKNTKIIKEKITWDELAEYYNKKTGQRARVMLMDSIYEWAARQKEITINKDKSLSFK